MSARIIGESVGGVERRAREEGILRARGLRGDVTAYNRFTYS